MKAACAALCRGSGS